MYTDLFFVNSCVRCWLCMVKFNYVTSLHFCCHKWSHFERKTKDNNMNWSRKSKWAAVEVLQETGGLYSEKPDLNFW